MPTSSTTLNPIEDPWLGFLRAVDQELRQPAEIHCIGGFALLLLLENARPTGDVDLIGVVPDQAANDLTRSAGRGSNLAADHKLYLQVVRVVEPPSEYRSRLLDAAPVFKRLTIKILDPYDLVLTKLERNFPRDREDVRSLSSELRLDGRILRRRFDEELRPYLAVAADRTTLTFELWMEEFFSGGPAQCRRP
jgi:hypothetical protein